MKLISESLQNVKLEPTTIYREDATEAASSYIIVNAHKGTRTIVSYNELKEMTLKEFVTRAKILINNAGVCEGWYHFEVS